MCYVGVDIRPITNEAIEGPELCLVDGLALLGATNPGAETLAAVLLRNTAFAAEQGDLTGLF